MKSPKVIVLDEDSILISKGCYLPCNLSIFSKNRLRILEQDLILPIKKFDYLDIEVTVGEEISEKLQIDTSYGNLFLLSVYRNVILSIEWVLLTLMNIKKWLNWKRNWVVQSLRSIKLKK